jgi:hypothetical protein
MVHLELRVQAPAFVVMLVGTYRRLHGDSGDFRRFNDDIMVKVPTVVVTCWMALLRWVIVVPGRGIQGAGERRTRRGLHPKDAIHR